jgi:hypothetical protein
MRTPSHITELKHVPGIGRISRNKLAQAFPTRQLLKAATETALVGVVRVKQAAIGVRRFLDGVKIQIAGKKHVTVWNKKTKKVIKGCCAPTEDKLEDFLARCPDHEVRRVLLGIGRRRPRDDSLVVPARTRALSPGRAGLQRAGAGDAEPDERAGQGDHDRGGLPCAQPRPWDRNRRACAHHAIAFDYGLVPSGRLDQATGLIDALCGATTGSLADLRKEAATSLGVSLEQLDAHLLNLKVDAGKGAPERAALQGAYATIARSAHEAFLLPVWVITPSNSVSNVFVVGDCEVDGGLPPIRLCQVGRDKFIPLFTPTSGASAADASAANAQAAWASAAAEPIDVEDVPQFKTELKTKLRELDRFLVEVSQDRQDVHESADVDQLIKAVRELMGRTESAAGLDAVLLGMNGIGARAARRRAARHVPPRARVAGSLGSLRALCSRPRREEHAGQRAPLLLGRGRPGLREWRGGLPARGAPRPVPGERSRRLDGALVAAAARTGRGGQERTLAV